MNQLREICRVIRVVENATKAIERNPGHLEEMKKAKKKEVTLFDSFLPRTQDVLEMYKERYKCTRYQARTAFKDAAEGLYTSTFDSDYKVIPDLRFNKYIEVNPSGRTLNSTVFKIPTGRYNTWLKDNGNLVNFMLGGGAGVIITAVTLVIHSIWG